MSFPREVEVQVATQMVMKAVQVYGEVGRVVLQVRMNTNACKV